MPPSLNEFRRKQPVQKSAQQAKSQPHLTTFPSFTSDVIRRATTLPTQLMASDVINLQRSIGNRAVAQLLAKRDDRQSAPRSPVVQETLTVGSSNDRYEQEADRVAKQVTATHQPAVQRTTDSSLPLVGAKGGSVDSRIGAAIHSQSSSGDPLPQSVQRTLEPHLGRDLSRVRTHTNEKSAELNQQLGAKAFTHGKHIFLGARQSPHDVQLMAHELTHTIQQGAVAPAKVQRSPGFPKLSHAQPRIQREDETIEFQGHSKTIEKGNKDQFQHAIGKMSSKGVEPVAPNMRPKAVMLMGAPGAGKSSIIDELVPDKSNFVHADADQVKEAMPRYQRGLLKGTKNISNKVHAQSKEVTKHVATQAIDSHRNLLFDGTCGDVTEYMALITALRKKNYHITLAMVHVSIDEGLKRVAERAQKTGREVPEDTVQNMYNWVPRNFPPLARLVDQAYLFDNMVRPGEPPILLWETSDGTKLAQDHLDYLKELLTGIEGKQIDNAPVEDDTYNPPLVPLHKARYLQSGGTSRWQKETNSKKHGFGTSRKNIGEIDEKLKLYRQHKSKNRGNAEEQAQLLLSLQKMVSDSHYQTSAVKGTKTFLRRFNATGHLRDELQGEFRRNAIRLAKAAGEGEQINELVQVGFTTAYLSKLLKRDVKLLYQAHVALAFRQNDLAQKALDKLNPVEREQTGDLKYRGHYVKRSRDKLHFAQQMLTSHHSANIGGVYARHFGPTTIDDQSMNEITTNYIRNDAFLPGGVVHGVKKPVFPAKRLKHLVPEYQGILSSQELEAIRIYSKNVYQQMNATMHDIRLDNPETQKGFKGYSSISQVAVNGLSKLPSYVGGPLYRGDRNFGGLVDTAQIGTTFQSPSFISTSKSATVAANFGATVGWLVYPAPNSRGKDIEGISTVTGEQEVMFPPGTKMRVIDVIRRVGKEQPKAGENDPTKRQRLSRNWKSDSGKPITQDQLNFMVKFQPLRDTLIIVQE